MNALTLVWLIYLLIVAAAWMTLLVVASAIGWAIYKGWCWFRAWRAERQLSIEIRARRGWKKAKRMGWLPKDMR